MNDWRWVHGVNVMGVVHGIQSFVPRMIASGEPGFVVNTSSGDGGIAPMPTASVYAAQQGRGHLAHRVPGACSSSPKAPTCEPASSTRRADCCAPGCGPRTATGPPSWPASVLGPARR